jgi:spore coat protein A, manganese oxidase
MKKFYPKFFVSMLFVFEMMNLYSQAPPVTTIGTPTLSAGTYSVPVTITGFTNVGNISMTLKYDPNKLIYTGVTVNSGLLPSNTVTTPISDQSGTFKLSYTQATAVVLNSPADELLTLTFTAQPNVRGVVVPLTWSTIQGDCDITPPIPGVFNPAITVENIATYFINGSVSIPVGQIISGPAIPCPGSTGNVYTTLPGMTGYDWTVSAGGTVTGGTGTNSITVTWNSEGAQTVDVSFTDPVNGQLTSSYLVQVSLPVPSITGPVDPSTLMPATLGNGVTTADYTTEAGMSDYTWAVSPAGVISAGQNSNKITVTWTDPTGQQTVSVNYTNTSGCAAAAPTVLIINYYPFAAAIDPAIIKQFVDPLPHFAAGLRVNAKAGGNLVIKASLTRQVALSKGTPVTGGIIDPVNSPTIGQGNYAGYAISKDGGTTFGPTMWPAQTIEAQQGHGLMVEYRNELFGVKYDQFNILADQTLMMNGYGSVLTGNPLTDPYKGPIPMVVHLHGGEMPSGSDGGPSAWFMPGGTPYGPTYQVNQSSISTYPNQQEATTLWYHPHDDGLTRINVYTGLAGYYFLRGDDEEQAHLPGWSGDDKVRETTPAGSEYAPTFNGTNTYLPEVEIAIQDRMFNVDGGLYWPVAPPNPEIHPFWTPEFVGDVMTVNGKTWPYLSVAPRKYRFRMLEGCNARFLNMWLAETLDPQTGATLTYGPKITVIGGEGGLLATPIELDPANGKTLLMAPGQRYDVIIDFTGMAGKTFTLMNNAGAPYPDGDPVVVGTTDRIMKFIVNGELVSASNPNQPGTDNSQAPANLRPATPLVQLTDFSGNLSQGVNPDVHRQIVLNEVSAAGGPAAVLINNTYFESDLSINPNDPYRAGGPTEIMREGTTEKIQIINISADAHPIHIHLIQWQLVSRQTLRDVDYMNAYASAFGSRGIPEFPAGLGYPGGAGPPKDYYTPNTDGALGGNPSVSSYLTGPVIPANPEERGWKDNVIVLPGEVTTFLARVAPTDRPVNATQQQLLFPFDPSQGPGYVWHCHIVDHEDMSMMRGLPILPSTLRMPQILIQPLPIVACVGDNVTFSVSATGMTAVSYQWQILVPGGTWTNLSDGGSYSGSTGSVLTINPSALSLSGNYYRCELTNSSGVIISDAGLLTVNNCQISGTLNYGNSGLDPLAGFTITINSLSDITDASGNFTITGITSGVHTVNINPNGKAVGAINSTDAGLVNYWFVNPTVIPHTRFMAGDVDNNFSIIAADALRIQNYFVLNQAFNRAPWQFHNAAGTGTTNPPAFTAEINGSSITNFNILGLSTGDFNGSFNPNSAAKGAKSDLISNVKMEIEETLQAGKGMTFELPIRSVYDMEVGAVSLIMNFSTDQIDVVGVTIKDSNAPVSFKLNNNQLRIGWNSLTPVNVKAGSDLIILKLKASPSFIEGQSLTVSLEDDPLNEIAAGNFKVIDGVILKSSKVEGSSKLTAEKTGNELTLSIYPNPVSGPAILNYALPFDGQVKIQVFNSIGVLVRTLADESKTTGKYTMNLDFNSLTRGVYMAKITLRGNGPVQVYTARFVVNY